ncbi:MAG: UDP-N-acetylmuramoyl-L-alanyl-D-glutamate--2,6-diaminopimelate ligase [Bacteroidales bacterium]
MKLLEIADNVKPIAIYGSTDIDIVSLGSNSQKVTQGQCFVALQGTQLDGHDFIDEAILKGATAIICKKIPKILNEKICYLQVQDTAFALALAATCFYANPSKELNLVGITGTNGKTTTATLLYELFQQMGYKVGLISTVVYKIHNISIEATHTTPDATALNSILRQMVEAGCEYCFMEVSSHAVVQGRIDGLHFIGGIFSNITHDHLDYHKTFGEYLKAKKMFFDKLSKAAFALTNIDDRNGKVMLQNTSARAKTYGLYTPADFKCRIVEQHLDGMLLNINGTEFWTQLIGDFNAYNICAIYSAAILLGAPESEVLRIISTLKSVAGRFEYVKSKKGITGIIDYAHTPDALQNVINTINRLRTDGQKLIAIVGCGGNRDRVKRSIMAKVVSENTDVAILTSDNPRKENPEDILAEMYAGVAITQRKNTLTIVDRKEAIKTAIMLANKEDIILIAGKGHETYQIIGTERRHFDDKETLRNLFIELDK